MGTILNWFRFWDYFETEIDKQVIILVSTFLYLLQFLFPQVCKSIDGFPFTPERFVTVKSSVSAYIEVATLLPGVKGTNPNVIRL